MLFALMAQFDMAVRKLNRMPLLVDHKSFNGRLALMTVRQDDLISVDGAPAYDTGLNDEIAPSGDGIVRGDPGP